MGAGGRGDVQHIVDQGRRQKHLFQFRPGRFQHAGRQRFQPQRLRPVRRTLGQVVGGHRLRFLGLLRVACRGAEQEAIQLGFGQRVGAFELQGVLRGDHQKFLRQGEGFPIDGDLPLLHGFQQRRLRFRPGPVDLIDQQQIGEHRPGLKLESRLAGIEDMQAGDVGRHQIRSALDAPEVPAQHLGEGLAQQGLAHSGRAFQQDVAAPDQRDAQLANQIADAEQNLA